MSEQNKIDDPLLMADHEYDGIFELDNPLPRWWLYGFYLTIIWSALYVGYYHMGPGRSLEAVYQTNVSAIQEQRAAARAGAAVGDEVFFEAAADPAMVAKGQETYAMFCAACHGGQGEGMIGPNLADAYWLHGGAPSEIAAVIRDGVGDKGMPPWDGTISPEDTKAVVAYILSIQGSNPPNAKEPQGELYEPAETAPL